MNNLRVKIVTTMLFALGSLSFVLSSSANDDVRVGNERTGVSALLVDQGDYYIHPDGRKIKFYRKQDVYAIETNKRSPLKAKAISSMARFKAQFGDRVSAVKGHRLGTMNLVRIDNRLRRGKSSATQFKIQASMLKSLDTRISGVQPVLANEQGQGDILVTTKILIRLNNANSASKDIAILSQRFNLRVIRRLNTSGALFQVESLSSNAANTGQRFSLVRRVMQHRLVDWAQPVFKSKATRTRFQPNDSLFDRQWHLRNTGQEGSRCDADCDANNAWDISDANGVGAVSGLNMVIAVIDDGVQLDHEDLLIWENSLEVNGVEGEDDDGNGFVDDINGWDFVDDSVSLLLNPFADIDFCSGALTASNDPSDGNGIKCRCQDNDGTPGPDNDPSPQSTSQCLLNNSAILDGGNSGDEGSSSAGLSVNSDGVVVMQDNHGTSVAGLAAARGNNGLGVAGTAYSAQVLPIRLISDFDGDINSDFCARAVEAMTYAGRHADVVNNSWTTDEGTCPALDEVIALVVDGDLLEGEDKVSKRPDLGSPVIFSAGNNASGWVKVTVPVSAGLHAYEWRFLRAFASADDIDELSLDDSAWLDEITFPDGSVEQFEGGIATGNNGFTLGCEVNSCNEDCVVDDGLEPFDQCLLWGINSDPNFSRSGNSATINHSENLSGCNHSYLNIGKNGPVGEISFWIWVSTDLRNADQVEFLVDGEEQLSFGDISRLVNNGVAYPANLSKVIAVGASDSGDLSGVSTASLQAEERTSYSQFGTSLDVLAPSSNQHLGIVTTDRYGASGDGFNANTRIDNEIEPGRYTEGFFGTSASAPIVAGIAAAMIASASDISAQTVEQTLQATADKIGRRGEADEDGPVYIADVNGNTRSDFYGYGRANMFRALQAVQARTDSLLDQICDPEPFSYTVENDRLLANFAPSTSLMCPALGPEAVDDSLCLPIRSQNGRIAVICL